MRKSNLELEIIDLARGGWGVARDPEGCVIFVPWSVPGDRVLVHQFREKLEKKNYQVVEKMTVLQASPLRIKPLCPIFSRCGGCQWQHLAYPVQWAMKQRGVYEALSRAGVTLEKSIIQTNIPAAQLWNYRNRIQLHGNKDQLGFYQAGSRELVNATECWIAQPELNQGWEDLRLKGQQLQGPYKVELELRTGSSNDVLPHVVVTWNAPHAQLGFRQVHEGQNALLKRWIQEQITGEVLYDFFGGSGNLSVALQHFFKEIHCIDQKIRLSAEVEKSIQNKKGKTVFFYQQTVKDWLKNWAHSLGKRWGGKSAVAIFDPPRLGLGEDSLGILRGLKVLGVTQVCLVGCQPDAWARDLKKLIQAGWCIEQLLVIDLFPQTIHVETAAKLSLNLDKRLNSSC